MKKDWINPKLLIISLENTMGGEGIATDGNEGSTEPS